MFSFSILGCKSATDANNNGTGLSGTIYFNTIETASSVYYKVDLGSGTVTKIGFGSNPNVLPNKWILGTVNSDLAEMSPDGSQKKVIVKENAQQPFDVIYDDNFHDPQMSPDGKYIAYDDDAIYTHVYVVDMAGNLVVTIGDGNTFRYSRPVWGPDGSLYMAGEYGNYGIFKTDKNFATLTRIDPNLNQPIHPSISPDGRKIAFSMQGHIWLMNSDGTGQSQFTTGPGTEDYSVWSPDGKWITAYGTGCNISAVEVNGTTVIKLQDKYSQMNNLNLCPLHNGQFDWK
jgi:Tol biopolymer transport system component